MQTKIKEAVWTESAPVEDRNVGSHVQHRLRIDTAAFLLNSWQRVGTDVLLRAFSKFFDILGFILTRRAFLSYWTAASHLFT